MGITYTNNGDGTSTTTLEYTANTTKMTDLLVDAVQWLYTIKKLAQVPVPGSDPPINKTYDQLTNNQRLNVFFKGVQYYGKQWAGSYNKTTQMRIESDNLDVENKDKYEL